MARKYSDIIDLLTVRQRESLREMRYGRNGWQADFASPKYHALGLTHRPGSAELTQLGVDVAQELIDRRRWTK